VAPLWDNDEFPSNDNDQDYNNKPPRPASKDVAHGNKVVIEHFSNEKRTQVRIDATVAKQLLKDLLVDPLSYADFDHIPPITQAQLDFLVARIDSVVPPPPVEEITDPEPQVGENPHMMEPTLEDDDGEDQPI
jgi:hypothetical protein